MNHEQPQIGTAVQTEVAPLAYKPTAAAAVLGVSKVKLWQLCSLPESDPRRIRKTSYGTIPKTELERHLKAELNESGKLKPET